MRYHVYMGNTTLPLIKLSQLLSVIETIDVGDVRWPFVEVSQRCAPEFGKRSAPTFVKRTYMLKPVSESVEAIVQDSFLDELARIRNTPLTLEDASLEFGNLLQASGRKPTHIVEVGKNLYAVIAAQDLHVRSGMVDGVTPSATLISLFNEFPVFRVRRAR